MRKKVVDALDEIYKLMSEAQTADVRGDTFCGSETFHLDA